MTGQVIIFKRLLKILLIAVVAVIAVVLAIDFHVKRVGGDFLCGGSASDLPRTVISVSSADDDGDSYKNKNAVGHNSSGNSDKHISGEAVYDYDCILVLGAAVHSDGKPSKMLQDRLDKAIELYKKGVAPKLLMSGDNGQVEYNEVECMKAYALEAGIPEESIFLDHAGFSTYESIYRARDVFAVKSMVIVTQRYHEYRALYIANRLGNLQAYGIYSDGDDYAGQLYREAREVMARVKDFGKVLVKPEPTYLGDVVDISGDGRKSWN